MLPEENKKLVLDHYESFVNQQDAEAVRRQLAPDFRAGTDATAYRRFVSRNRPAALSIEPVSRPTRPSEATPAAVPGISVVNSSLTWIASEPATRAVYQQPTSKMAFIER